MKKFKLAAELLHAVLILTLIVPFIYNLALQQDIAMRSRLYGISLLIAVPVIAATVAVRSCRNAWSYFALNLTALAVTGVCAWHLGELVLGGLKWGYFIILMLESVILIIGRFAVSMRKQQREEEQRRGIIEGEEGKQYHSEFLENPRLGFLVFFSIVYIFGMLCANPPLCNEALGSAILYSFFAIPYHFMESMENYLKLRKRVANLPSKRVYGISRSILMGMLAVVGVAVVLSVTAGNKRLYTDIRNVTNERAMKLISAGDLDEFDIHYSHYDDALKALPPSGGLKEGMNTEWLSTAFMIAAIIIVILVLIVLVRAAAKAFEMYRESQDENGDLVEELKDEVGVMERSRLIIHKEERGTFKDRIRRNYRKVIRRNRQDRPASYETPLEIETAAHIADNQEGKLLHRQYEDVRYGR